MSHDEQIKYVETVVSFLNKENLRNSKVLEIGSYDRNGSIRNLFNVKKYAGADLVDGPGVDIIYDGLNLNLEGEKFDICISCECFEHDQNWVNTFNNMINNLIPGGLIIFTCASKGRIEHGTKRTNPKDSPGTSAVGVNYYRNLREKNFREHFDFDKIFKNYLFYYYPHTKDLYFIGNLVSSSKHKFEFNEHKLLEKLIIDLKEVKEKKDINLRKRIKNILLNSDIILKNILLIDDKETLYQNYMLLKNKLKSTIRKLFS